jgi:hypothetical protein
MVSRLEIIYEIPVSRKTLGSDRKIPLAYPLSRSKLQLWHIEDGQIKGNKYVTRLSIKLKLLLEYCGFVRQQHT